MEEAKPAPPGWMEERERVHWRMCWVVSLYSVSILLGGQEGENSATDNSLCLATFVEKPPVRFIN